MAETKRKTTTKKTKTAAKKPAAKKTTTKKATAAKKSATAKKPVAAKAKPKAAKAEAKPVARKSVTEKYHYAIGRRKTATATVRLFESKGISEINGKPLSEFFPREMEQARLLNPFAVADLNAADFHITARVRGSGPSSQLQAVRHALSRAIIKMDPSVKKQLKIAGLVIRDPRMVERKKPGLHKARKGEQYSKR